MRYVTHSKTITYDEIIEKQHCMAPSKFPKFNPPNNDQIEYVELEKLITESKKKKKLDRVKYYYYI